MPLHCTVLSIAHYLNNDALRPLPVKLSVIDLLPGTQVKLPGGHRHDHLVMNEQALEVRVAIRFSGLVMPVVVAERRELFQPFIDIGQQPILGIVDPDSRGDMHSRHENHTFLNAALPQRTLHLAGDVNELAMLAGVESEVFGKRPHEAILAHRRS